MTFELWQCTHTRCRHGGSRSPGKCRGSDRLRRCLGSGPHSASFSISKVLSITMKCRGVLCLSQSLQGSCGFSSVFASTQRNLPNTEMQKSKSTIINQKIEIYKNRPNSYKKFHLITFSMLEIISWWYFLSWISTDKTPTFYPFSFDLYTYNENTSYSPPFIFLFLKPFK